MKRRGKAVDRDCASESKALFTEGPELGERGACTLCGRTALACKTDPCLRLTTQLTKRQETKLRAWSRQVGVAVARQDGTKL